MAQFWDRKATYRLEKLAAKRQPRLLQYLGRVGDAKGAIVIFRMVPQSPRRRSPKAE